MRQLKTTKMSERDASGVSFLRATHFHGTHMAARRQASVRAACMSRRYTHHVEEEDAAGDERRRHTLERSHDHMA